MNSKIFAWLLLAVGILLLVACILCAFAIGTIAVPILLVLSILTNSTAIMLMRRR